MIPKTSAALQMSPDVDAGALSRRVFKSVLDRDANDIVAIY